MVVDLWRAHRAFIDDNALLAARQDDALTLMMNISSHVVYPELYATQPWGEGFLSV